MSWGPVTADYDWCESNYVILPFVAEFFNTVSSIPVLLSGLLFLRRTLQYRYGNFFTAASIGVAIIGLGSMAFHGTLLRWAQVLDELPMLWSSLTFLYISCILSSPPAKNGIPRPMLAAALAVVGSISTVCYFSGGFIYFIIAYSCTIAGIVFTTVADITGRPAGAVRSTAAFWAACAVAFYVGGSLLLWIPEQIFCGNRLETSKKSLLLHLPIPLHAFFHLTSAAGPLCWLTYASYSRMHHLKRSPQVSMERSCESFGLPAPVVRV